MAKNVDMTADVLYNLFISLLSPRPKAIVNSGHIACLIVFKRVAIKLIILKSSTNFGQLESIFTAELSQNFQYFIPITVKINFNKAQRSASHDNERMLYLWTLPE